MASVTSASRYITSASHYHLCYQSRSSMYIRSLISLVLSPTLAIVRTGHQQATEKKLMGFSIKYRFIILISMAFIENVTLHSNLLCWHGFHDVNVTVNVGIYWRRQSCFCGCLVNLTICNKTYDWPTNRSPPHTIHDQFLI